MAKVPPAKKSRKGAPPAPAQTVGNLDKGESPAQVPMNFKVSVQFHREFKAYAAMHGKSMLELLQEGFLLVKEQGTK